MSFRQIVKKMLLTISPTYRQVWTTRLMLENISSNLEQVIERDGDKKLSIFIWGDQSRFVFNFLRQYNAPQHNVVGFIDKSTKKERKTIDNVSIFPPEYIITYPKENLSLIATEVFWQTAKEYGYLFFGDKKLNFIDADKYIMFLKFAQQFPLCMEHIWESDGSYSCKFEDGHEDLIMEAIFNSLGIKHPKYMDIGAYEPIIASNTYLFYLKGSQGIVVEPTDRKNKFDEARPRDTYFRYALSDTVVDSVPMYSNGLTYSFDERVAQDIAKRLGNEVKTDYIKQEIFNNIADKDVQLIDIDTDAVDMEILQSIDFKLFPDLKVICIEQIGKNCIDYMMKCGYVLFCQNVLNSIFIHKSIEKKVLSDDLCREIKEWHLEYMKLKSRFSRFNIVPDKKI